VPSLPKMPSNLPVGSCNTLPHPFAGADNLSGENNLSFIETSALDASNVELAFQNILTGMQPPSLIHVCFVATLANLFFQSRNLPYRLQQGS